jgi:hypothetical protein
MLRVVVRHAPNLYAIVGLAEDVECPQTLTTPDSEGASHTFFRVKSTPRWVLYHAAVEGHGGNTFNSAQR